MKLLTNLNASKAAGPDQLSGRLLKATARESAEILQVIFQRSIDEGVLPEDWKKALITPVYKKASRSNLDGRKIGHFLITIQKSFKLIIN